MASFYFPLSPDGFNTIVIQCSFFFFSGVRLLLFVVVVVVVYYFLDHEDFGCGPN